MKKMFLIILSLMVTFSVVLSMAVTASAERNWIISPTATVYPATTNNGGLNTSAPDSTNTGDNTNTDNSHQENTDDNSAYNTDSTRNRDRNNPDSDKTSHSRAEIIDTSPFSPDTGNSSNSMYAVIIALFSLTVVSAMILKKGKTFKNEKNFN